MKEGSELSDGRVIVDETERDVMHGELCGSPNSVENGVPNPGSLQTDLCKSQSWYEKAEMTLPVAPLLEQVFIVTDVGDLHHPLDYASNV